MPRKPKKPCSYPGCPELVDDLYCEKHQKIMNARYEKYERNPTTKNRYGRVWKRIRVRYITAHPLCEQCIKEGRITVATEVHHKLPLSRGGTHDVKNLMALCTPCHSRITAESGDRWHSWKKSSKAGGKDKHKNETTESQTGRG